MAVALKGIDLSMRVSPNAASGIGQYYAVVEDVAGGSDFSDVILATVTTQPIMGINQDMGDQLTLGSSTAPNVTAGETIAVRTHGFSKAVAGAAITRGQYLQVNASGQLVPIASLNPAATATNTYVVGQAETSVPQAGDIFTVRLMPGLATLVTS